MGFLLVSFGRALLDLCVHFYRLLCWCLRGKLLLRLVTGDHCLGIIRGVRGLIFGRGVMQEIE